jgi:hypothetical protein
MVEMVDILWRQQLLLFSRGIVRLLSIKGVRFLCSTNSLTRPRNDTRVAMNVNVKDNFNKRERGECKRRKHTGDEWKNRDDWRKLRGVENAFILSMSWNNKTVFTTAFFADTAIGFDIMIL